MDYNKLKTFLMVAENQSVTAAAARMRRTQSAVSQQLRLLEDELGLTLFDRKQARVFLTPEGESLFRSASLHYQSLEDNITAIKKDLSAVEGQLAIGVLPDFCYRVLSPKLAAFKLKYPKINLNVYYGTDESLERDLLENRAEIGIFVQFNHKEFFDRTEIYREEHILVCSKGYLKERGPFSTVEKLLAADLLDISPDFTCFKTWLRKNYPSKVKLLQHRTPSLSLETESIMERIVTNDFGIALIPKDRIEEALASGQLVQLMPQAKSVFAGFDLAVKKKRTPKLARDLFVRFMTDIDSHGRIVSEN